MTASAYHVISKEADTLEFLDAHVNINNPHWQRSGIIKILQILHSHRRYTGSLFLGCALFVAGWNIIRALWETNKELRLNYKKKVQRRICVSDITFMTARAPFYVIFITFFVYFPSQVTYLLNGPNKDTWYCYRWYSV